VKTKDKIKKERADLSWDEDQSLFISTNQLRMVINDLLEFALII